MPRNLRRYNYVKVYRPRGMAYATGRDVDLKIAMSLAKKAFMDEFGYEPRQEHSVFECVGGSFSWVVDFFEVKD
jgi:hypothetical protein